MNVKSIIGKLKFYIWCIVYTPIYRLQYWLTAREREKLDILNAEETCKYIIEHQSSIARYGDGEFQLISHWLEHKDSDSFNVDSFQEYSPEIGERLFDVLVNSNPDLLVCIPYPFKKSSSYKGYNRLFFEREYLGRQSFLRESGLYNRILGDSTFTRFYLNRNDIKSYSSYISAVKKIWDDKDVLVIEGEFSRLGIGNDLFDNTKTISRVICPATNAYSRYQEILRSAINYGKGKLVIIALGQTATILASDLCRLGIQAIDLGHIDIEYEWYLKGAKQKIAIEGKYVNEADGGRIKFSPSNKQYESQIVKKIL